MFEVGFTEIILIFGIALLVLGPERLPKLAADLGRWAGRARSMARTLRTQLEQEVRFDPLQDEPKNPASTSSTIHTPAPATDESVHARQAQLADQSRLPGASLTAEQASGSAPADSPVAADAERASGPAEPAPFAADSSQREKTTDESRPG